MCVTIINSIANLAIKELVEVVFNHWALGDGGVLGSSCLSLDSISPSENVLESFVLKSVGVDIDHTSVVGNTSFDKLGMRNRIRVDVGMVERMLNCLTTFNVFESSDFLSNLILVDLDHFPAELDINSTFEALIESNLICIRELEDLTVGGPVLNLGTS